MYTINMIIITSPHNLPPSSPVSFFKAPINDCSFTSCSVRTAVSRDNEAMVFSVERLR